LITDRNYSSREAGLRLDDVPLGQAATIARIDWTQLGEAAARRLRALGFDAGVTVEPLHRGVFGSRDPIAVRIGRMQVALRRTQAAAIEVETA
jgi:ferrous iron transport protein A